MTQPVKKKILRRILGKKRGWVFTPSHFLDLGSYQAVTFALKQFCDVGRIRRLARGLYDRPKHHPTLGDLSPTPNEIATALAKQGSLRIQPSGAYAANLLGLSEQVPARIVFLTDGINRRIAIDRQEIIFKQTTPKNMATAGRVSGLVIQALRYLGKEHVDDVVMDKLARRLSPDERRQLLDDVRYAPAWIGAIFRQLAEKGN